MAAQGLPTSHGAGEVPPSLCRVNQCPTAPSSHVLLAHSWRTKDKALVSSKGLQEGGCAPLPRAGAAFSLPFLNFDFSRCEKWDCNISAGRARFGADRGGFVQCSRASWASARGLSCLPEDAFPGLLHSHVKFSCKDVGTGRGLFCLQ